MDPVMITWPGAVAIVASVVALTVGAIKIMGTGKTKRTIDELHADHQSLSERVHGVETQMVRLESDLQGTITTQISDLKGDIRRMDQKMDTLVKEVVAALASLTKKG